MGKFRSSELSQSREAMPKENKCKEQIEYRMGWRHGSVVKVLPPSLTTGVQSPGPHLIEGESQVLNVAL